VELIVVHDDVGVVGWAGNGEVELLGGDVAVAPGPFDFGGVGGGSGQRSASVPGAIYRLLEGDGHEDAQVPSVDEFWAQEEDAVEEQYGVCGCGRGRWGGRGGGVGIEDRALEPSVSAWA